MPTTEPIEIPLDEFERVFVAQCREVEMQAKLMGLEAAAQLNAACTLAGRRAGIEGKFQISPDGTKLVRPEPDEVRTPLTKVESIKVG